MAKLMVWFVLSQALCGFPTMQEGTRLQIVSPDLLTVHGEAFVAQGQLVLQIALVPESEVKIIISYGTNGAKAAGGGNPKGGSDEDEATLEIYPGIVAPDGEDILLAPEGGGAPVSLREFLEEECDIRLFILRPDEG